MELSDELTPSSNRRDGGILEIHRYMAIDTAKAAVPKTRKFDANLGIETSTTDQPNLTFLPKANKTLQNFLGGYPT